MSYNPFIVSGGYKDEPGGGFVALARRSVDFRRNSISNNERGGRGSQDMERIANDIASEIEQERRASNDPGRRMSQDAHVRRMSQVSLSYTLSSSLSLTHTAPLSLSHSAPLSHTHTAPLSHTHSPSLAH